MSGRMLTSITAGTLSMAAVSGCSGASQRSDGRFVFVEAAPGIVTVLPEWMLDPVICAGMEVGAPWVTVEALINLQRQLIDARFQAKLLRRYEHRPGGAT